ncbi:MAG: hypothetical protein LWX08_16090 [Deltaproteobacteria bacterium]|nr:hypothetical protein [Deltaproteobacteria bacterium]
MVSKVGFEVYLLVFYAKFLPDFVPVSIDCTCGQIKKFRNFFRGFTLLRNVDEITSPTDPSGTTSE